MQTPDITEMLQIRADLDHVRLQISRLARKVARDRVLLESEYQELNAYFAANDTLAQILASKISAQ